MSTATHTKAHLYACPEGHAGQQGTALRTIVPDGLDLAPACTACRQPMTPADRPLRGNWRVDDCCTPAGPGGRWAGPPRDPAVCVRCFGTRRAVICTTCLLPGCLGDHGDTCLACDGTGRLDCASCEGEGHRYNQFNEDEGLCPDPGCVAGRVTCETCGGTGAVSADRPAERAGNQGLWREFSSSRAGRNRERPPARSLAAIWPIPEVTAADRPGRIRLGRRPVILPGPLDALALQLVATRRGHRVLLNGNRTVVLGLETLPGIPSARRVSLRLSNGRFR